MGQSDGQKQTVAPNQMVKITTDIQTPDSPDSESQLA